MKPTKKRTIILHRKLCDWIADNDEWTFKGYIVTWNTIDDYNSIFKKGSFKKTISERGDRIKILWNNKELIGKVIEIFEDSKGVFVMAKGVTLSGDVYEHLEAGAIDTLSFGFIVLQKNMRKDGVFEITEVKLYEFFPVIFFSKRSDLMMSNISKTMSLS